MLKVLYVSPNGYLGGAEKFILTATSGHIQNKKIEAAILFFSDGEACREAKISNIKYFILKQKFRMRSPWSFLLALREIRSIVKSYNPDVLHLTMPYSHIALSLATLGMNLKKVWFQHGPVGGRLDQLANFFPVDMIWYNSKYLQIAHHQTWPQSEAKAEFIIKLGVHHPANEQERFSKNTIEFGTAGRICSWKGFHNIILAFGELQKEMRLKSFRFSIAGTPKTAHDQIYFNELKVLVENLNLNKYVIFLEHIEKMDSFYQSIDIFVHASVIAEPFGLVVAEAMANGCLAIASSTGGVADLIQNRTTGISYSATSPEAREELKKILAEILNPENKSDFSTYRRMANTGRSFIRDNYSSRGMLEQIEDLYFKL